MASNRRTLEAKGQASPTDPPFGEVLVKPVPRGNWKRSGPSSCWNHALLTRSEHCGG